MNFFGIVLQIAIHGDDHITASSGEAVTQPLCLAEVASMAQTNHAWIALVEFLDDLPTTIL